MPERSGNKRRASDLALGRMNSDSRLWQKRRGHTWGFLWSSALSLFVLFDWLWHAQCSQLFSLVQQPYVFVRLDKDQRQDSIIDVLLCRLWRRQNEDQAHRSAWQQ